MQMPSFNDASRPSEPMPLHLLLLSAANLMWTFSAPPTAPEFEKSLTGEVLSIRLVTPFFARHGEKEAFVFPQIVCGEANLMSPRDFLAQAMSISNEQAQDLANWVFQDIYEWSDRFNGGRQKGSFYKQQALQKACLTLARMDVGLVNDNGFPSVSPLKTPEFYAFMDNDRYTKELGSALSGIEIPGRIKERLLPMMEASALREVIQATRAEQKAQDAALGVGFPDCKEAEEAFTARSPKRI